MILLIHLLKLDWKHGEDFHKVRETLTRMGLVSRKERVPILWQSCYLLHKKNKYYIVHFKQLFQLDGEIERTNYTEDDKKRTKLIAYLLDQWELLKLKKPLDIDINDDVQLIILPYSEKVKWKLRTKYHLGQHKY